MTNVIHTLFLGMGCLLLVGCIASFMVRADPGGGSNSIQQITSLCGDGNCDSQKGEDALVCSKDCGITSVRGSVLTGSATSKIWILIVFLGIFGILLFNKYRKARLNKNNEPVNKYCQCDKKCNKCGKDMREKTW